MAAVNMYPLLVILLLVSPSGMVFAGFGIPTSEASNLKTFDECKKQIYIQCLREVGGSIFEVGTSVTNGCCHNLKSVGKTCHDIFFNYAFASKPNVNKFEALATSTQVRNQCVEITIPSTSSITIPTSKASKLKSLDECKKHISIKCAREVGGSIFEGVTSVTNGCCHNLVSVEKTCHDLFFHYSLASIPNVDKSEALAKSTQVWN
ncbi:hypothetical protein CerSpe_074340 [Prunus speciosa]